MKTLRWAVAASAAAALAALACGDPVVVQGDLPGIMRVVVGVAPDADPGSGPEAIREQLQGPRGLATTADGLLVLADPPSARVLEVSPSGSVRVVLDHGACTGDLCVRRPEAIALDGRAGVLIADPSAGRVWRVPLGGGAPEVVAGRPGGVPPMTGGDAAQAELDEPAGVAAHPDGSTYFAERGGHRIWKVERNGALSPVAGVSAPGHVDGAAATSRFRTPSGLFLHGTTLFVADQGNHRVRAVSLGEETVTTVAGTGSAAFSGDGGNASDASLRSPEAVAVTLDGISLFIADKGNHRIRRVNLATSSIATFAGTGEEAFTGSGSEAGTTALASPAGLATLGGSFLFVADTGNRLIWRTPIGL